MPECPRYSPAAPLQGSDHSSTITIMHSARVNSFEAPATSPLTPPKRRRARKSRTVGQRTITTSAPAIFTGASGRRKRGRQRSPARAGKYRRAYWWRKLWIPSRNGSPYVVRKAMENFAQTSPAMIAASMEAEACRPENRSRVVTIPAATPPAPTCRSVSARTHFYRSPCAIRPSPRSRRPSK